MKSRLLTGCYLMEKAASALQEKILLRMIRGRIDWNSHSYETGWNKLDSMKIKYVFGVIGLLLMTACVEQIEVKEEPDTALMNFTASMDMPSKTTLVNQTEVFWCSGDMISLKDAAGPFVCNLSDGEISEKVIFTGNIEQSDMYYAVYPYYAGDVWEGTTVERSTPVNPCLIADDFGGVNVTVASTSASEMDLVFKNVLGYLKFSLSENPDMLSSVMVKTNGGEPVSGHFYVDCSDDNPQASPNYDNCSSYLFAQASSGNFVEGSYYVPMLPGTYTEGITVHVARKDGMVATLSTDQTITLNRGYIQSLGSFDDLDWEDPAPASVHAVWKGNYVTIDNGDSLLGFMDLVSWNGFDWSDYSPGDVLKIYGGPADENLSSWNMILRNGSWNELDGTVRIENPGIVSITLTETILADLVATGGLGIWGKDYMFNLIEIIPQSETNPSVSSGIVNETVIWKGDVYVNWNGMSDLSWGTFDWSAVTPGTVLTAYFSVDAPDYSCLRIANGSWQSLPSLMEYATDDYGDIVLQQGMTSFSLILTEDDCYELINNGGLVITGVGFTLEKLTLSAAVPLEKVLWQGEIIVDDWTNHPYALSDAGIELQEAGAQPGQVVNFYVEPLDEHWKLHIVEGHWGPVYSSYCSVGNDTEDGTFTEYDLYLNGGKLKLELTQEILDAAYTQQWWGGTFVLSGDNLKVTKITLE